MTVIHWYRPKGVDDRHETKVSVYDEGTVQEIERRLVAKNREQGHEVTERGGNWTGAGGSPVALHFDLLVTLGDGFSITWEHAVCEPSDPWLRDLAPTEGATS